MTPSEFFKLKNIDLNILIMDYKNVPGNNPEKHPDQYSVRDISDTTASNKGLDVSHSAI